MVSGPGSKTGGEYFTKLFKNLNYDYALFYQQVERMSELDKNKRSEELNKLIGIK